MTKSFENCSVNKKRKRSNDRDSLFVFKKKKITSSTQPPQPSHIITNKQKNCCVICLKKYHDIDSGELVSCNHKFCFDCILEWSGYNNTCPLCRTKFSFIEKKIMNNKTERFKIKSRDKKDQTISEHLMMFILIIEILHDAGF